MSKLGFNETDSSKISQTLAITIFFDTVEKCLSKENYSKYQDALKLGNKEELQSVAKNISSKEFSTSLSSNTYKTISKFLIDVSGMLDENTFEEFKSKIEAVVNQKSVTSTL